MLRGNSLRSGEPRRLAAPSWPHTPRIASKQTADRQRTGWLLDHEVCNAHPLPHHLRSEPPTATSRIMGAQVAFHPIILCTSCRHGTDVAELPARRHRTSTRNADSTATPHPLNAGFRINVTATPTANGHSGLNHTPLQSPSHSASSTDNPRCRAGGDSPWARVDSWWRDWGRMPSAGCEPVSRACRRLWLRRSMGVWCDASRAEIIVQTPAVGDVRVDDVALLGVVWATARVAPAMG